VYAMSGLLGRGEYRGWPKKWSVSSREALLIAVVVGTSDAGIKDDWRDEWQREQAYDRIGVLHYLGTC
jgi:hypothetical protein